jgi:5-methylcytosine-specific restriction endonuclease McrA
MTTSERTCRKCGLEKPATEWGRHPTFCLACLRAYGLRRYHGLLPTAKVYPIVEKVCPGCGELKPRVAFGEKRDGYVRELCRPCAAEQQRQRRLADPQAVRERKLRYEAAHPEKRREHASRRRARLVGGQSEPVDYKAILERDGLICGICRGIVAPADVHIDHVIPLAAGGAHSPANLQVAHSLCNLRKHARVGGEISV